MESQTEEDANESGRGSRRQLSLTRFLSLFVGSAVLLLGLSWLFFDESLGGKVANWISSPQTDPIVYSCIAIGVLASDLLLPIPSSAIMIHAGIYLGIIPGTFVGFLGLTAGSFIGFGVARFLGSAFVEHQVDEKDRRNLHRLADRYGVFVIVILRPIPILAEASVLLLAAGQMSWRPFLIWLSVSNFFVALFFAAFGQWAKENGIGELPALLIGISIPILLLVIFRFLLNRFFKWES